MFLMSEVPLYSNVVEDICLGNYRSFGEGGASSSWEDGPTTLFRLSTLFSGRSREAFTPGYKEFRRPLFASTRVPRPLEANPPMTLP